MKQEKKYVLVTGGAGFLGSHLCEKLLANGVNVLCVDDYSTGIKENIDHLLKNPRFEFHYWDITKPIHMDVDAVDEIYNLACPASPIHYQSNPVRTIRTSVLGALNMLDLARRSKARILQASTSEVYGDPAVHPQPEAYLGNVNPIGPRACYDEGKRCAETLFFDYHRQYGLDICVARIFNTYGPRMRPDDGRVVPTFITQALVGESLAIHGSGNQSRSFCYVNDIVTGLIRLMNSEVQGPVNLGNPIELTIAGLAEHIIRLVGSTSSIVYLPRPVDDPQRRCPDITLARTVLYWAPVVLLVKGLSMTIEYFRGQ